MLRKLQHGASPSSCACLYRVLYCTYYSTMYNITKPQYYYYSSVNEFCVLLYFHFSSYISIQSNNEMTKHFSLIRRSNNRQRAARPTASRTNSSSSETYQEDETSENRKTTSGGKLFLGLSSDLDWTPTKSTVFKILVSLRMSAGIWSPISDCDEVYNYWEPLHLLLYGSGFQTWEYSPIYAIRYIGFVCARLKC